MRFHYFIFCLLFWQFYHVNQGTILTGTNTQSSASISCNVTIDTSASKVYVTLKGSSSKYVGYGFGGTQMTNTYAMVGTSTGVSEYKLGNRLEGTKLTSTVTLLSNTVSSNIRTVVVSRSITGSSSSYYSFPTSAPSSFSFIYARGASSTMGNHDKFGSGTLSISQQTTTGTPTTGVPTTGKPTKTPTKAPSSVAPTKGPTAPTTPSPTKKPTTPKPTTKPPTKVPTTPYPSLSPTTGYPTSSPTTAEPTPSPTTPFPTVSPTFAPVRPTRTPTTPAPTTQILSQLVYYGNITLSNEYAISVSLDLDLNTLSVYILLAGPANQWFGVGFGHNIMSNTYAIVVEADGDITEYLLDNHTRGTQLPWSGSNKISVVDAGIRYIQIIRSIAGSDGAYYTFPMDGASIDLIWATGDNTTLSQHLPENSGTITLEGEFITTIAPTRNPNANQGLESSDSKMYHSYYVLYVLTIYLIAIHLF